MITGRSLYHRLRRARVTLTANETRLAFDAPAGSITPELRDLMRAHKAELIGVVNGDVAADFHALQSHRAATERILTTELRDELDAGLAETLKRVGEETGGALAKLWAMIPHQNCPLVFHHLLGSLLGSVPPENRQAAAELARVPEWSMQVRVAQTEHGATITADRQGRVEIARLEQSNPRVLGSVE